MKEQFNGKSGEKMPELEEHISYLRKDPAEWKRIRTILNMIQRDQLEDYADTFITEKHPESADELLAYYETLIGPYPWVIVSDEETYDELESYTDRIYEGLRRFDHSAGDYIRLWDEIIRTSIHHRYEERMAAFVEAYPMATYEQVRYYCDYLWSERDVAILQSCDDGDGRIPNLREMIDKSRAGLEERAQHLPELLALVPHSSHHNYEFHVPMSEADFQLFVVNILQVLEYKEGSYLSIAPKEIQADGVTCIQSYPNEDGKTQYVEVIVGTDGNWRAFIPKEPLDLEGTIRLYRAILIEGVHPDLSTWTDRTEEIRSREEARRADSGEKGLATDHQELEKG